MGQGQSNNNRGTSIQIRPALRSAENHTENTSNMVIKRSKTNEDFTETESSSHSAYFSRRDYLRMNKGKAQDESQATLLSDGSNGDHSTASSSSPLTIQEVAPHPMSSSSSSNSNSVNNRRSSLRRSKSWTSMLNLDKNNTDENNGMEEFYLKNRRPGMGRNGLAWKEDPTGQTWLHHGRHWPRDYATIRGRVVCVKGKKWLLATHVRQVNETKWNKAPKGAALPFFYSNLYCLVPTSTLEKDGSSSSGSSTTSNNNRRTSLLLHDGGGSTRSLPNLSDNDHESRPRKEPVRRLRRESVAQESAGLIAEEEPAFLRGRVEMDDDSCREEEESTSSSNSGRSKNKGVKFASDLEQTRILSNEGIEIVCEEQ